MPSGAGQSIGSRNPAAVARDVVQKMRVKSNYPGAPGGLEVSEVASDVPGCKGRIISLTRRTERTG